jgi:dimethylhistidine N-methyltransferase
MQIFQAQTAQALHIGNNENFRLTKLPMLTRTMKEEVLAGLRRVPKVIQPKYLYDEEGSRLFDLICALPEYYLTRVEISILRRYAGDMLDRIGRNLCVIEPGAGACQKARFLLETDAVSAFFPVDISADYLRSAALKTAGAFPHVSVHATAMDFLSDLPCLEPLLPGRQRRVIFYPGSSIGNFDFPDAGRLLTQFGRLLRRDDALLIGYDLKKDPKALQRAYDDSRGITAAFNLNLLARFNRELKADFDLSAFRHVALYNEPLGRIELHLESATAQEVKICAESILFNKFERVHTENSYKYTIPEFNWMAARAGFEPIEIWTDPAAYFAVGLYFKYDRI